MEIIALKCLIHETVSIKFVLKLFYKENNLYFFSSDLWLNYFMLGFST